MKIQYSATIRFDGEIDVFEEEIETAKRAIDSEDPQKIAEYLQSLWADEGHLGEAIEEEWDQKDAPEIIEWWAV